MTTCAAAFNTRCTVTCPLLFLVHQQEGGKALLQGLLQGKQNVGTSQEDNEIQESGSDGAIIVTQESCSTSS